MKYLNIIIIAILFGGCSSTRNLEKIENHEVVFLLYEKSEFIKKSKFSLMNGVSYYYQFNNKKGEKSDFFLTYTDYDDLTDLEKDIRKKIKFKINKSFLKANKNKNNY
ncbi:hypothetical protein SAMN05444344_0755 [Tenacibaculum mesophilum]|uniref:DUF4296 domain-containing protein n=1 Tax=Tenacibaculum mesophilum TaxID=104268 RepID=A0ABM7CI18_9FLAO|nr:hypothetical protein [Tenacibaculum mesophilum]AZJ33450.1 hypothetical protein D6200_13100 [Tenacibaculum mesophilum]QFS28691.1 hypothetical protein F9Y86_09915 [Tenacibaculum mesophilum]SHF60730.1 hypothetical protein SAMN05444344_0755 [Tenacibaculum mesophilum]